MNNTTMHKAQAKTVTALVPTYNRAQYLIECLDSLLSQTRKPDQIIVIDDGSSDNTESVVRRYAPEVQYIKKENGGKSSALNTGMKLAAGDYIWVCDDDDLAAPKGLEAMLSTFEKNSDVGYVFGDYKVFSIDENGEKVFTDPLFTRRQAEKNTKINFLEGMFVLQYACLVKREVYESLGGYNENLIRSQDYDMMLRISRIYKGGYAPDVVFYYRYHEAPRGKKGKTFKFSNNNNEWLKYDHIIFDSIYIDYSLSEFTPSFAVNTSLSKRAALLQRAVVMAGRSLWVKAASDLLNAAKYNDESLSRDEAVLLKAVVRRPDLWLMLRSDIDSIMLLRSAFHRSKLGREIVVEFTRPLIWVIKNLIKSKEIKAAVPYILIYYKIFGARALNTIFRKRKFQ